MRINGATLLAGVAGSPVTHSLSPLIHNAWIAEAGIDAAYLPFSVPAGGFVAFANGLRGGIVRGLNVTIPFKEEALALADEADDLALRAGAANLLVYDANGAIRAFNTDGPGLLEALKAQAPGFDPGAGPAVILGGGGAARGAAAALLAAGAPAIRLINRTRDRVMDIAEALGAPTSGHGYEGHRVALTDANVIINATSLGLGGGEGPDIELDAAPASAVVMDMVYKPLDTLFLRRARAAGYPCVDGLEMLVRQAVPSFEAFFGQAPPANVDVRALALTVLEPAP